MTAPSGLDTRVAVVSGGAQGIGWAVAEELAHRGYHTAILDRGASLDGAATEPAALDAARRRLAGAGLPGEVIPCDVRDRSACREVIDGLVARFGGIDVLVNAAGILRPGPFLDDTPETWDLVVSTHVGGHLNLIAAALPAMVSRRTAQIVNFTSTAGLLGSRRQPAYSTAKEAIVGLTRYLARHLDGSGVTVNAVSPGAITRMSVGLRPPDGPGSDRSPGLTDRDPAAVGAFVGWLTDRDAAGVTGRVFMVSGRYVIEYDDLCPWKWAGIRPESDETVEEVIRWVLGRPHPAVIGPWPTRDFALVDQERQFEGTTTGPTLADDGRAPDAAGDGAVVHLEPTPDTGWAEVAQDPIGHCAALADGLRRLQVGIGTTRRHDGRGVVVVLPGELPSLRTAGAGAWLQWYGAVGLVRGGAATEGIYGVRVNGLACAPGSDRLAVPVTRYLLSPASSWLNGYIVTVDAEGVGVLADERPAWQVYTEGGGLDSLTRLRLLRPLAYERPQKV